MSKLTSQDRRDLPTKSFALPGRRAYPIQNANHARNALARVAQHGSAAERRQVRDAVANRYPYMKQGKPK